MKTCKWTEDLSDDDVCGKWDTECGNAFWFAEPTENAVEEHGFEFCCYCGGQIK